MGILISLIAAAALAGATETDAAAPAVAGKAVEFVAPDRSFAATFPGEPTLVDGAWKSRDADRECAVMPIPMERDSDTATSGMILNMMLARFEAMAVEQGYGSLMSSDQASFAGRPARAFVINSGPNKDEQVISQGRLVRTDTHMLVIACDSPRETYDEAAVTAFVDSLVPDPNKRTR